MTELNDDELQILELTAWIEQQPHGTAYLEDGFADTNMDRYLWMRRQGLGIEDAVKAELKERMFGETFHVKNYVR